MIINGTILIARSAGVAVIQSFPCVRRRNSKQVWKYSLTKHSKKRPQNKCDIALSFDNKHDMVLSSWISLTNEMLNSHLLKAA